ncbi:MAG: HlyD family efflux transporter periplasmic adaptor subunit [Pseudomonadota bacterium]
MTVTALQDRPEGQDLNTALRACFVRSERPPFAQRLVNFTAALTNARSVAVMGASDDGLVTLASSGPSMDGETVRSAISELNADGPLVSMHQGLLIARIAMPDATDAYLAITLPPHGSATLGLAYERLSLLSNLSFAEHRNADAQAMEKLARCTHDVARGDAEALQALVDTVALATGAEYAAVANFDGQRVSNVNVSGQSGATKRAAFAKSASEHLTKIGRAALVRSDEAFAARPGSDSGLVILTHEASRNPGVLPLVAALYQQAAPIRVAPRRWLRTLRRIAVGALVAIGVGLVPLPDGADVAATVAATNARVVTAPVATQISSVEVRDGVSVEQGDLIVSLDDKDVALELIGLQAERATALLEQEAARAARNPALLRNAELSVAQLDARIALLQSRQNNTALTAPISGVVMLGDLPERVGATLRSGEELFVVADPAGLRLDLTVTTSQIDRLGAGVTGTFRPDFDPSLASQAEVTFVSPAIDDTVAPPVMMARAQFDDAQAALRPGLTGVFRIDGEATAIWRLAYRAIRDWTLLNLWY